MRELPAGDEGLLLDFADEPDPPVSARQAANALTNRYLGGASRSSHYEVIASATSILIQALPGEVLDELDIRRTLREARSGEARAITERIATIPVRYDGADIAEVGAFSGVSEESVINAHRRIRWRVEFMGFAPGFGYLIPDESSDPDAVALFADLGRRPTPRPRVPAGSVAVAAGYSAVYPRASPGGWYLLGRTEVAMWNAETNPPALLTAGTEVRFVDEHVATADSSPSVMPESP